MEHPRNVLSMLREIGQFKHTRNTLCLYILAIQFPNQGALHDPTQPPERVFIRPFRFEDRASLVIGVQTRPFPGAGVWLARIPRSSKLGLQSIRGEYEVRV